MRSNIALLVFFLCSMDIVSAQCDSSSDIKDVFTALKIDDQSFRQLFLKEVSGAVKIPPGKSFGFIDDIYINPSMVKRYGLSDGIQFSGTAIKSYNKEKKVWGWKLL